MWSADVAIERVAVLNNPVAAAMANLTRTFGPDTLLLEAKVNGTLGDGHPVIGKLFCELAEFAGASRDQQILAYIFNFYEPLTPRLCFRDGDNDGRFEEMVAVGKLRSGPVRQAISPISYAELSDRRVPGATVEIRPRRNPLVRAMALSALPYFRGRTLEYDGVTLKNTQTGRDQVVIGAMVPKKSFPSSMQFGDFKVTILRFDAASGRVTARLEEGFTRSQVHFLATHRGAILVYDPKRKPRL